MRRLYGSAIDEAIKVDAPGMEIGTQHRYSRNILLDFKPEEALVRPETLERMRFAARRRSERMTFEGPWPTIPTSPL